MELTAQGFTQDTPETIRTDITNQALAEVDGFTSFPTELRQNLIDEAVIIEMRFQDGLNALMNGIGPDFANDQMFKQFGCSFGMTMKDFQYAQATLRFSGLTRTVIPKGTRARNSAGTVTLATSAQVVIGSTGEVDVLAVSTSEAITDIPAGSITVMVDVISGVTVTNPAAGTSGIQAETIDQFKTAVYNEIQSPRYGGITRAYSLLRNIEGVDSRLIHFRTMQKLVTDVYYQGIECVVGGGDDYEVANALFTAFLQTKNLLSDPSGGESARTVSVDLSLYGSTFPVKFTRPKQISGSLTVTIAVDGKTTTSAILEGILKPAFEAYFDSIKVGEAVSEASMNQIIYTELKTAGIETANIGTIAYSFELDSVPTPVEGGYLPLDFDQYISLDTFAVSLT
jgi:hypothetical protein